MPVEAVARQKISIKQTDFSLGEVRPDYLEADEAEVRLRSVRSAMNVSPNRSGSLRRRPGRYKRASVSAIIDPFWQSEIEPVEGTKFLIVMSNAKLTIIDDTGSTIQTFVAPWAVPPGKPEENTSWVVPARDMTYFGSGDHSIYILQYDAGSWAFGAMAFSQSAGGAIAQPYFAFAKGITLTPSALSGSVTITASASVFTVDYVGLHIRIHGKEIQVTGYTSGTVITGTVLSELAPSLDITVVDASGFETGEVINGVESDFSGYVVGVDYGTNILQVVTLTNFEGPYTSGTPEKLAGALTTSSVTSVAAAASQYATPNWEEPVLSAVRGYPRSGAAIGGRMFLADFEEVPDLIVGSSVRSYRDFEVGLDDDDAIIRTVGEVQTRVRHVVDGGDLIILTDIGAFVSEASGGTPITPNSFAPVLFDVRGANSVKPKVFGSTVVYMSTSGDDMLAAALSGNIYLKWAVTDISQDHSHLINSPTAICPPPRDAANEDRFALVVNAGGGALGVKFADDQSQPGFFPWGNATEGAGGIDPVPWRGMDVQLATPFNGRIWSMVSHEHLLGSNTYTLEEWSFDAMVDSAVEHLGGTSPSLSEYDGAPIAVWQNDNFHGIFDDYTEVEALISGAALDYPFQVGINFDTSVTPWPVEFVSSPRLGMVRARTIRVATSVFETISYFVRRNNTTTRVEGYSFGDDLSAPPSRKTQVQRFPVLGNRDHPEIEIGQDQPGPFELLAITTEVQA